MNGCNTNAKHDYDAEDLQLRWIVDLYMSGKVLSEEQKALRSHHWHRVRLVLPTMCSF